MKKLVSVFISLTILISTLCFPFLSYAGNFEPDKTIYADSYVLVNLDDPSYPVVADREPDTICYPAALTMMVSAMVAINKTEDLSKVVVVSENAVNSVRGTGAQVANLKVGETISIEELLYMCMLHSACDAAVVLAEGVSGSVLAFVNEMNALVESLELTNTHFTNPNGLHDSNMYTTASDMSKLALKAMESEAFMRISTATEHTSGKFKFIHTNLMLHPNYYSYYYRYAEGIKSGTNVDGGHNVVVKASKGGYNYLAVVMNSRDVMVDNIKTKGSFIDAKALFSWAFSSLKYSTVLRKNDVVCEMPVNSGKNADTVQLIVADDVTALVPASLDPSAVIVQPINPPKKLHPPISKGEKVCEAEVIFGDSTILTVDLVSAQTVELSAFLRIHNALKAFFTNPFTIAIIVLLLCAGLGYLFVFIRSIHGERLLRIKRRKNMEELDKRFMDDDDYIPPPRK